MKNSLIANLCCPSCGQSLAIKETHAGGENSDQIVEGNLECINCCTLYPIHKGIPNLLSRDLLEEYKKQEMQGWVKLWDKKGMYERPTLEHSFILPYMPDGPWADVARMFDLALKEMNLRGDEFILDIGAGQGWAARYFAEKGCRVVAIDIVDDEWYGLGRAWAIMEKACVYFEPLLADGENLPFLPGTFDIVFFCGALHHFRDSSKVLRQAYRVLKPGGRLVAAAEPAIAPIVREEDVQAHLEEVDEGIVERRPWVSEYWWKVRRAGFENIHMDVFDTYNASSVQVFNWIVTVRHTVFQTLPRRSKYLAWLVLSAILVFPSRWSKRLALLATGGGMSIRASKPQGGR